MAKANQKKASGALTFEQFVKRPPKLTVLTDHPLTAAQAFDVDKFNLRLKLGPVYDIIRYPKAKTPMAILVSGDWGMGKTSAMRWLEGLLEEWNKTTGSEDVKVRPIWFYPWKYDNKDDVRRCLIAEVIINATYVRDPETKKLKLDAQKLKQGVKTLSLFAAKAAVDLASAVKIGVPDFGEVDGSALEKIVEDFKEAAHQEKVYLQEYEAALKEWVEKSLDKNERMVIFIDDLDRCMPDIGLQVLEALKLYLNIPKLVFVLGVDKEVVGNLVVEHYKKLGLVHGTDGQESQPDKEQRNKEEEKARQYLSKIFQVEIELEPGEKQIADFFDEQLKELTYWKEPHLSADQQELFRDLVLKFAGRNPREVKRILNSALMMGAGAVMIRKDGIKFDQGLQLYFVRKILGERYKMALEAGSKRGIDFFVQWSKIVRAGRGKGNKFPLNVQISDAVRKEISRIHQESAEISKSEGIENSEFVEAFLNDAKIAKLDLSFVPKEYLELLASVMVSELLHLLANEDLGRLMQIEYPVEAADVVGKTDDAAIVHDAVQRWLKEYPSENYNNLTALDLSGTGIADLTLLREFSNLQTLSLYDTPVADIAPLISLTKLQGLNLSDTQVADIGPLASLTNLQWLRLADTKVADIGPLASLTNLQTLDVHDTQVADIGPLASLTSLQRLNLHSTRVTDILPLASITNLQSLSLYGTQVANIGPLASLTYLQALWLSDTLVADISPLDSLKNLQALYLSRTQVADISPLDSVANLQTLHLYGTNVREIGRLESLKKLQWLKLSVTQVPDEQIAKLKKALPKLQITFI